MLNDFWVYDPANNKWSAIADFPAEARRSAIVFSLGDYIFVGGGVNSDFDSLSDFWRYSPADNRWEQISDLPEALGGASSTSIGSYGFVIGGYGNQISDEASDYGVITTDVNSVYRYSLTTNQWQEMSSFHGMPRSHALCFLISNKIYFGSSGFLAAGSSGPYWLNPNNLFVYTP